MQPTQSIQQTIVVTGGNAGIGEAIARQLARQGVHVVIVSRNADKGEAAAQAIRASTGDSTIDVVAGDLSSVATVRNLAAALLDHCPRIDVLINNAGIWPTQRQRNADGLEMAFMVNHLAPFLLSNLLLARLQASAPARVVNVNAGLYINGKLNLDRTPYGLDFNWMRTYADSKLCNMLFTLELARRLAGSDVTVNAVHPGVIRTGLGDTRGPLGWLLRQIKRRWDTPDEGAGAPVWLATAHELAQVSGKYFDQKNETAVTALADDVDLAQRLWELSVSLAGLDANSMPALSHTVPPQG